MNPTRSRIQYLFFSTRAKIQGKKSERAGDRGLPPPPPPTIYLAINNYEVAKRSCSTRARLIGSFATERAKTTRAELRNTKCQTFLLPGSVPFSLPFVCLSVCPFCSHSFYVSVYLTVPISLFLSLFLYLYLFPSFFLYICLCLSVCQSVCLSISPSPAQGHDSFLPSYSMLQEAGLSKGQIFQQSPVRLVLASI